MFLDPETRELLRVRPNPLTREQVLRLQGARPAGPPPRPRTEPVTVQRRVSANGRITVCRQTVALGRVHAGRMVRVHVAEHTLAVELDGETRTIRRTTTRRSSSSRAAAHNSRARDNVNRTLSSHRSRRVMTPDQEEQQRPDPYGT